MFLCLYINMRRIHYQVSNIHQHILNWLFNNSFEYRPTKSRLWQPTPSTMRERQRQKSQKLSPTRLRINTVSTAFHKRHCCSQKHAPLCPPILSSYSRCNRYFQEVYRRSYCQSIKLPCASFSNPSIPHAREPGSCSFKYSCCTSRCPCCYCRRRSPLAELCPSSCWRDQKASPTRRRANQQCCHDHKQACRQPRGYRGPVCSQSSWRLPLDEPASRALSNGPQGQNCKCSFRSSSMQPDSVQRLEHYERRYRDSYVGTWAWCYWLVTSRDVEKGRRVQREQSVLSE